jgi:Tfp pilus assembly protein PilV
MKRLSVLFIVALIIVSMGVTGCGRKQTTTVQSTNATLGQELVDLQQAYEKGIITQKEYDDLKKKAMKKYK